MLQPMHSTCNRLLYIFALKAILLSIGYNLQNPADAIIGHIFHWSRLIWRIFSLYWCDFIISHPKEILLPCLTRKTSHPFIAPCMSLCWCNVERGIGKNDFNNIADPLYKTLMLSRWYATVGMNLVPSQQQTIWPFAINNKESGRKGLTADCQVLGILASRINLQVHGYRCSFHLRVFQGLSNPQGTCVHSLLF